MKGCSVPNLTLYISKLHWKQMQEHKCGMNVENWLVFSMICSRKTSQALKQATPTSNVPPTHQVTLAELPVRATGRAPICKAGTSPCASCCSLGKVMKSPSPLSALVLQKVLRVITIARSTVCVWGVRLYKEIFQPAVFPSENLKLVPYYN